MKYLFDVSKPARYCGGEYGLPDMDKPFEVSCLLCFPDVYEIGMSNLGVRILYYLMNSLPFAKCERCFAPWSDMGDWLKSKNEKLKSIETNTDFKNFDFVGFSLQYEMSYSTVLYMLDLAGFPFKSADRGEEYPIVIGGGPCTVNAEPVAEFFDCFMLGEGETPWKQLLELKKANKNLNKEQFLRLIERELDCIYVPQFVDTKYDGDKAVFVDTSRMVKKHKEKDLENAFFPDSAPVPNLEIVHDRAVVELFRGCGNGCRFCQAGFIYRPIRERSPQKVLSICKNLIKNTGYEELSLNSLSTGDYSGLRQIMTDLIPWAKQKNITLTVPSLRLDSFEASLFDTEYKTSLTFAPEAGTQRLRDVINKNITEEDIFSSLSKAFGEGYCRVKLYFMIGLPTETMEDVKGIADMAFKIKDLYFKTRKNGKYLDLSVSVSTFIPKPFTPFEWEAFASRESIEQKQGLLRDRFRNGKIRFSWNDYNMSIIEALLARGGRTVSKVIEGVYKRGAKFDAWDDLFDFEVYDKAIKENNFNLDAVLGKKEFDDVLAWDFVSVGVTKEYLKKEAELAYKGIATDSCLKKCNGCGLKKEGFCLDRT